MKKRWIVKAYRNVRGRRFVVYTLGPFRSKVWAKFLAWVETFGKRGHSTVQCEVQEAA